MCPFDPFVAMSQNAIAQLWDVADRKGSFIRANAQRASNRNSDRGESRAQT